MMTENKTEKNGSAHPDNRARGGDVYQIVTDRILQSLEKGTVPWHKPWTSDDRLPMNLASGKAYRGINVFMLHMSGFGSPYWLSYKQIQERGGHVRKGEKASLAVFYKLFEPKNGEVDSNGKTKRFPVLRYYNVFNVEQCEGIEYPKPEPRNKDFNPIEACERVVSDMPNRPTITHHEQRAYYRRSTDTVNLPCRETFDTEADYYSTAFHELGHATGHQSRLGRLSKDDNASFGSGSYSKEELVAEMTAAFLCGIAGIENKTMDNSASYISAWLERLKNDRKLVVQAASAAHKAADYILGAQAFMDAREIKAA